MFGILYIFKLHFSKTPTKIIVSFIAYRGYLCAAVTIVLEKGLYFLWVAQNLSGLAGRFKI
jgi:hypothetical protein